MHGLLPLIAALAASTPAPQPADVAWVAEGEFCEPETVLPLPDDTLLVSNVCERIGSINALQKVRDKPQGGNQGVGWGYRDAVLGRNSELGK